MGCHRIVEIQYRGKTITSHHPHFEGYDWKARIKCKGEDFFQSHPAYHENYEEGIHYP
jgi:hypothetical protein